MSTSFENLPEISDMKGIKVALFGLSANPPTGDHGHIGIVRSLVKSKKFDEVWVSPVYIHPFSSKQNLLPYEDRYCMCKESMESESTMHCLVRVVALELEVFNHLTDHGTKPCRIGTIDIVQYLLLRYANKIQINIILGADSFSDLVNGKWKDGLK
jgi:nicotinic acid mononucleotide adenylyltransferase